ncbi:MAG: SDR family oxidoreductase [Deltaproteobacteria bacterium]|jgi:NAD(P)-dependent dehydrogenase (short-subunit alcohol dehydrogenase family)|nr:SDR family oxidoreductase [Deltaproteobacteria bacterium]
MKIQNSTALVTGASRGIGRALVGALLEAGAKRVYAAARDPGSLTGLVEAHPDRVVPLQLDTTDRQQVEAAARAAADTNLLINNAGLLSAYGLLTTPPEVLEREFATNFYGTLAVTRSMLPNLEKSGGAVVNLLTVVSLASMAGLGGYSASKAAAFSMTQALRAELKKRGVAVHAVFPGPVDTEMARDLTLPKTSPEQVAAAIVEGINLGEEDILPDPMSRQVFDQWKRDPKAVEQMFAAM